MSKNNFTVIGGTDSHVVNARYFSSLIIFAPYRSHTSKMTIGKNVRPTIASAWTNSLMESS